MWKHKKHYGQVNQMSVFCITFSVHNTQLTLLTQVDSTGFHATKLVIAIMLVKSIELRVSSSIPSSAKLFNLLWLIDASRYVKINFSLLNDLSQDATETKTVITSAVQFSNWERRHHFTV